MQNLNRIYKIELVDEVKWWSVCLLEFKFISAISAIAWIFKNLFFPNYQVWGLNPWQKTWARHGIWTYDHHKIFIHWLLKQFNRVKWTNENNTTEQEMASVPLQTCSGWRAIYDPLDGPTALFLHPVPYRENWLNYIKYKCNVLISIINISNFRTGGLNH